MRISGPNAGAALAALGVPVAEPRKAKLSRLLREGAELDTALVTWFPGPQSFTGEDVAELSLHGSMAVIKKVLAALAEIPGLRLAEAGEFSRRAFLNGKMDLTGAEGLADLIDAETEAQRLQAMRQMKGELGRVYEGWRQRLISLLANIEAYIDFPDEDLPEGLKELAGNQVRELAGAMREHLNDGGRGEKIREGVSIAILGAPNAGKSSLLNRLCRSDKAIVSGTPGTTRDVIEAHLEIAGFPVVVADTAGIREAEGEIEAEGIRRARERAAAADIKIVLFDAGAGGLCKESLALLDARALAVYSRADLGGAPPAGFIPLSVKDGSGMKELLSLLEEKVKGNFGAAEAPPITRARHRKAVEEALLALQAFDLGNNIELAAEDLRQAARSLGRITGKIEVDDILDEIFRNFCIGK